MSDYERIEIVFTILGFVATFVNIFITMRIQLGMSALKIWVMERFITKEDHIAVLKAAIGFDRSNT